MPNRLSKTGIEYLTHCWNFASGCENNERGICPINPCWARLTTKHFARNYPQGFKPTIYPEALLSPLKLKKSAKIGVCFMSDLFGDWINPEQVIPGICTPDTPHELIQGMLKSILSYVLRNSPQHTFLFLTKSPVNYFRWLDYPYEAFPDNFWAGITVWNDNKMEEACYVIQDRFVERYAKHRWLSFEPLLGEVFTLPQKWMAEWLVIGAYTGTKAQMLSEQKKYPDLTLKPYGRKWSLQPPVEWVESIVMAADKAGIRVFLKNNMKPSFKFPDHKWAYGRHDNGVYTGLLRQEYPSPSRTEV